VIVVVVGEEDEIDGRQVLEGVRRRESATRA